MPARSINLWQAQAKKIIMKHKRHKRTLGRQSYQRQYLIAGLTSSLLKSGSLITTEAKAKELSAHIETLISKGKRELTLANRRHLLSEFSNNGADLELLVAAAKASGDRRSGFTRLTRLPSRGGDGARMTRVDLIAE